MTFRPAASIDELWVGDLVGRTIGGTKVLLVRLDDGVRAYEDRCAHLGQPLSRGRLMGCVLTCPLHGWQYDAATGHGVNPVRARLRAFPVRIEDGRIWIDVDRNEPEA